MRAGIQEEVLRALVEQHAVRECLVAKVGGGPEWGCRSVWAAAARAGYRCAHGTRRCAPGPVWRRLAGLPTGSGFGGLWLSCERRRRPA